MDKVTTVAIDLAKRVFVLHGVDALGRVALRKSVRREQLMEVAAGLTPCLIGMKRAGGHEWARRFMGLVDLLVDNLDDKLVDSSVVVIQRMDSIFVLASLGASAVQS